MAGQWTPQEDCRSRPTLNLVYDAGTLSWIRQTQAGAGGGGTQYTEGDVDASLTGNVVMWEDAADTVVATSAAKPLPVAIISGAGSGGTAMVDDAAFTPAVTSVTPMGAFFDDVAPDSVNEGDIGAPRMSANRNLYSTLRDAAGNERGANVSAGNALLVDASATTQPISAAALPLPTGASTLAEQQTQTASLSVLDDWDETNRAAVNTIAGQVGVQGASGVVTALTQRVVLATDVALPAGDNNIGNVDIVTVPAPLSTIGGGTEATALRVTVATDSTGVLSVDDNGGSLTVDNAALAVVGGGVEATALRVTIASDSTGVLSVDDNGGSLTVDGTVAVSAVVAGTGATNLGKAEDAGHTSGDVGVMLLAVRNDTPVALAGTDLDYIPLSTDAAGALRVTGGGGGTEYVEDAAAPADPTGATFMMTRDDQLATVTEAEGDWSRPRSTSKGALWVALADSSGDPITSFGGGTQYAQGTASTDTDVLGMAGAVRRDTSAVATGVVDGDRLALSTNATGKLWVDASGQTLTVASHAVTNAGTFAVQVDGAALTALQLIDDTVFADDAAFTVGTSKVSMAGANAVAFGAAPDAADAGDAVALISNRHRILFTLGGHPNVKSSTWNATGAATDDNIMATIAGGTKYGITKVTVTLDEATTVGVAVRIGFGTANVPALGASLADAVDDILLSHPGLVPGSGMSIGDGSGLLGVGGDGAELRITCEAPTSGRLDVTVTWFPIES